jgi:hypothetical protein
VTASKKKKATNDVDRDLAELYTRAKKEKQTATCPHCKKEHDVDVGGDFTQMARAIELRLKYEAIKNKKDPEDDTPDFFKPGGDDGARETT